MVNYTILCILSIVSGIFYRMGGSSSYRSWYRDWLIPLVVTMYMVITHHWHWSLILCYPLLGFALSSYEYFLPDDPKKRWYNWALHGAFIALSLLPWCLYNGHWNYFLNRLVILPVLITAWTLLCPSPKWDELGRGFFIIATLYFI